MRTTHSSYFKSFGLALTLTLGLGGAAGCDSSDEAKADGAKPAVKAESGRATNYRGARQRSRTAAW
jgi:hypothetical protein